MILSCSLHDNLPNLVCCLQEFYRFMLVLLSRFVGCHRILVYDVVAQLFSSSMFHIARWKVTGEEHGNILDIYTLRYLNDTLSTSPF